MLSPRRDDPRRRVPAVDRTPGPVLESVTGLYGREVLRVQAGKVPDRGREEPAAGHAAEAGGAGR